MARMTSTTPPDLSRWWLALSLVGLAAGGVLSLVFDEDRAAGFVWAAEIQPL